MKHLHAICMITNPVKYKSRIRLFHDFQEYMSRFKNVTLWVVEGVYPGCDYEVTHPENPHHLRLELRDELWHKENLLNELVKQRVSVLAPNWEALAWIDADVMFARPDWVEATLKKLEEHPVVQMFSECMDLTDRFETIPSGFDSGVMTGTVYKWHKAGMLPTEGYSRFAGHYGYAWAMRRDAWDTLGGLLETGIVGSSDYLMTYGLFGDMATAIGNTNTDGYYQSIIAWGERCKGLTGVPGYVDGLLMHHWHGPKIRRGYNSRQRILDEHRFDPNIHLARQANGAFCWNLDLPGFPVGMIQDFKDYFRSRDEDASAYTEEDVQEVL